MSGNIPNSSTCCLQNQEEKFLGDYVFQAEVVESVKHFCPSKSVFVNNPGQKLIKQLRLRLLQILQIIMHLILIRIRKHKPNHILNNLGQRISQQISRRLVKVNKVTQIRIEKLGDLH